MPDTTTAPPSSLSRALIAEFDLMREACGLYALDGFAPIVLTGEDRKGWLQGQATANVRSFLPGGSAHFCLCEATGHLLTFADAWALDDRFAVTLPAETADATLERMRRMIVMEDVEIHDACETWAVHTVQGPKASARLGEFVELPTLDALRTTFLGQEAWVFRANRTGLGGWDVWLPRAAEEATQTLRAAFPRVSPEAVEIARLEAGIPRWGLDAGARTLPPELGPLFENRNVSYNKGCYVGQEVLQRMHSRGHANRRWMALVAESPLVAGAEVVHPRRPDAGRVTSAAESPDWGYIAGAMLRTEAAFEGERVVVRTPDGDVAAEVRAMPLLRIE